MDSVEEIYNKALTLDPLGLQELEDFLDFLLSKREGTSSTATPFPASHLEDIDTISPYEGRALSLDEMDRVIEWEAGRAQQNGSSKMADRRR
ncbi:MAG: hypothetical protein HQL49_10480 [Gammaproteobacteria bacterium]|nr:hypothetical protein [Gammaproteobacteria bacterium]